MGLLDGMVNDIIGADMFDTIYKTLNVNLFTADGDVNIFSSAYETIHKIYEVGVQPVAVMLLFIYLMLAVIDKLSSENFTWEQLWRQMAMLLGAKFLIDRYGTYIFSKFVFTEAGRRNGQGFCQINLR